MGTRYNKEYDQNTHGETKIQTFYKLEPNAKNKNPHMERNNKNNTDLWLTNKNLRQTTILQTGKICLFALSTCSGAKLVTKPPTKQAPKPRPSKQQNRTTKRTNMDTETKTNALCKTSKPKMDNTHSWLRTHTGNRNNLETTVGNSKKPHHAKKEKNAQNKIQAGKQLQKYPTQTRTENVNANKY